LTKSIKHTFRQLLLKFKEATALGMYVLIDFHTDLFSRYVFNQGSSAAGNGAPEWVVKDQGFPQEFCGVCLTWTQNLVTNEAVRKGLRNFWNNAPINTPIGTRYMQDAFLWQMDQTLRYLKSNLTASEFALIQGVDPINEPADGGMNGLSVADWENKVMWPLYRKIRTMMDNNGWYDKPVYAEPLVFWNTSAPLGTGGHHVLNPPTRGFVFNAHFYDGPRQMGLDTSVVNSATYLPDIHKVRDEARFMGMPFFLSEFGMFNEGTGNQDPNRIIGGVHQAMESSDALKLAKDRFADAYSPPVSGTQWHWDWYADRHHEYMNGNPNKLLTAHDAWNGENFSAISVLADGSVRYNIDSRSIERVSARAAQGDVMAFHYNALARDKNGTVLNWQAIRPVIGGKEYFRNSRFALLTWRGRNSNAPTELFLPREFSGDQVMVVTDKRIYQSLNSRNTPDNSANEVMLTTDMVGANRLLVWDDVDTDETANSWHYVLVVKREGGAAVDATLQQELNRTIVTGKLSPVYFTGTINNSGYAPDVAASNIQLKGTTAWLFGSWASFNWSGATGDVDIYVNNKRVDSGAYQGSRSNWQYWGATTYQVCEKGGRRCSNTWTAL
jgi:hypothetical protein